MLIRKSIFLDELKNEIKTAIAGNRKLWARRNKDLDDGDYTEYTNINHEIEYSVILNNEDFFCILFDGAKYSSFGSPGQSYKIALNINPKTGNIITFNDIFCDNCEHEFSKLLFEKLNRFSDMFFTGWEKEYEKLGYEFCLDKTELIIIFSKYSLGPGSMGVFTIGIPYIEIKKLFRTESSLYHMLATQ